jgi:hypothetical protein
MNESSAPIHDFQSECIDDDLMFDDDDWLVFEQLFCEDSTAADSLAHMLFWLVDAIESGEKGKGPRAPYDA